MARPIVFLFPGQGSQYYHMGEDLYRHQAQFRYWVDELDRMLYHTAGYSVTACLFDGKNLKSDPFDQLLYTHPAIFIMEIAMARFLMEQGIHPDYMLGTSLGDYAAAAASGMTDIEQMLEFVAMQAIWVEQACAEGRMLAVLHDRSLYEETDVLRERSQLAADNFNGHFVVSGETGDIERIGQYLRSRSIACQILPVTYAFHSSLIDPVEAQVRRYGSSLRLHPIDPRWNLRSSIPGGLPREITEQYWWDVVRQPIQFREAVIRQEASSPNGCFYIDLGSSGTLASFARYIIPASSKSEVFALMSPFGQDRVLLQRLLQRFQEDKHMERV